MNNTRTIREHCQYALHFLVMFSLSQVVSNFFHNFSIEEYNHIRIYM